MSHTKCDPASEYANELDAAANALEAHRSDLESLLAYILAKPVSRPQLSRLLRQSWLRLNALRTCCADLSERTSSDPAVTALIDSVHLALQAGETLSFDTASQALEKARAGLGENEAPALISHLQGARALIAAIAQDHQRAATLYADAAAEAGEDASLQWRYHGQQAAILADLGREFADDTALQQSIDLYENTVLPLTSESEKPQDWATTQHDLGNALGVLAQRQGGTWMLEKAIRAFEAALTKRPRLQLPLEWAQTQNSLGNALGILGQRQKDTEMLERSRQAFESALEEYTQAQSPHEWASTQNNLGAILLALGQQKNDARLLKEAVEAYKQVLQEWGRDRVPLDWATTLDHLGTALRLLGEKRKGSQTLKQSVAAYHNALAERTRERVPQEWAMTQNNLGTALHKLGEREGHTPTLEQAMTAFENALLEWPQEKLPMTWAMTMANLASTQKTLAELLEDANTAEKALARFQGVAQVFRNASHAQYYEFATEQVAITRKVVDALGGDWQKQR